MNGYGRILDLSMCIEGWELDIVELRRQMAADEGAPLSKGEAIASIEYHIAEVQEQIDSLTHWH